MLETLVLSAGVPQFKAQNIITCPIVPPPIFWIGILALGKLIVVADIVGVVSVPEVSVNPDNPPIVVDVEPRLTAIEPSVIDEFANFPFAMLEFINDAVIFPLV